MELRELVDKLEQLDEDQIICVMKPWGPHSDALTAWPDDRLAVPEEINQAGFAYFLEVHVAREVVGVLGEKPSTLEERVRLLLEYAEADAYPDWVYQR